MRRIHLMISILALAACSGSRKEPVQDQMGEATSPDVLAADAFHEQVMANQDIVLIDVRSVEETAEGIIPGAQVIDFNAPDFTDRISSLDKEANYYVYCKSGMRSTKAAEAMVGMGFRHVHTLEGGLNAWAASGFEVQPPE